MPHRLPILLACVHLPSKLNRSPDSQLLDCFDLARQIGVEEQRAGHSRTIVVGDFNLNPFENGMVSSSGLNSVMSRQVASRGSRTVDDRVLPFFYNPMWTRFGDGVDTTSYFYDASEPVNYYWNIFDQVLIRPELANRFDTTKLEILRDAGPISLVSGNGRPDRRVGSDHLPIRFEVEF